MAEGFVTQVGDMVQLGLVCLFITFLIRFREKEPIYML